MKKLLLSLLLVASCAHAERWLEMPNNAGGKILLLESKCNTDKDSSGKLVIATTPQGANVHGCWYYFADMIHVAWKSGESSSFSPNDFTAKQK